MGAFKEDAIRIYNKVCGASEVNLPPVRIPNSCPDRVSFNFMWMKMANGEVVGSIDYAGRKGAFIPNIGIADLLLRLETIAALYCEYAR